MPPPLRPTRVSPTTVVLPRGAPLVTTPRGGPPIVVTPAPVALDAKGQALALIAEVHAIKHQMSAQAHRVGVLLKALSGEPMLAALGCASFDDLLVTYDLPNRMTALKYIALAEHFGEAEAIALGAEKGYALVRYGQALPRPEKPALLLSRDAKLSGVLLRDSPAAAILRAARELAERQREGAAAEDDTAQEADRAVRRLGSKLRRAGAPGAKLKRVRRGGAWRVIIELDADEALALAGHL